MKEGVGMEWRECDHQWNEGKTWELTNNFVPIRLGFVCLSFGIIFLLYPPLGPCVLFSTETKKKIHINVFLCKRNKKRSCKCGV